MDEIIELSPRQPELVRQAIWIYEQSFPAEEREPSAALVEALSEPPAGGMFHFQVLIEGSQVLGLSIFSYYPQTRLGFIPYLAVHPERRSAGLGQRLYRRLVETVRADGVREPAIGVTFEVERPELGDSPAEQDLRRRRIGFYLRQGAVMVPHLALVAPPLGPGLPAMPYEIMLHPLDGCRLPLDRAATAAVVQTVLGFGYDLDADDPFYQQALASIDL